MIVHILENLVLNDNWLGIVVKDFVIVGFVYLIDNYHYLDIPILTSQI